MTSHLSEWLSSINQQTSVGNNVEKRRPMCTVGGNADWCSHCGKAVWSCFKNLKMDLPYDPEILLLGL